MMTNEKFYEDKKGWRELQEGEFYSKWFKFYETEEEYLRAEPNIEKVEEGIYTKVNKIEQQEIQIKSLVEALGQYVDKLREMDKRIDRLEA